MKARATYSFGFLAALVLASAAACSSSAGSPTAPESLGNAGAAAVHNACHPDVVAPVISGVSATPSTLWPPNHKWWTVRVSYTLSDNCGGATAFLSVASDEPVNGLGDGNTEPDWEVVNAQTVRLRAERSGTGDGRVYTITITATDAAGNQSSQNVQVTVVHDQRKK
jgi:hypothetical protein